MKNVFKIPFFNPNINKFIGKNNVISKKATIHENVTMGNYNKIGDNVTIFPNCKIGDNNNIDSNVTINPNCKIGNNNIIFPRNVIGEYPCSTSHANDPYETIKNFYGVEIGNNNFFHIENIISSGIKNFTIIGNNNRFLGENFIHHDVVIENNITFYPRATTGGYSKFLNYSNIGMAAVINQRTVIGEYSMIGSNNTITKHVFPYFITINNKIQRINKMKTPPEIDEYELVLKEINENFLNSNYIIDKYHLPESIKTTLFKHLDKINK